MLAMRYQSRKLPSFFSLLASAGMVPPFTLFEFGASKSSDAFRANNVKSGTCVVDTA